MLRLADSMHAVCTRCRSCRISRIWSCLYVLQLCCYLLDLATGLRASRGHMVGYW